MNGTQNRASAQCFRIIEILRDSSNGYVSGAVISDKLGMSRTAVWKHITSLRKMGYRIEARHSRGYRLKGDDDLYNGYEIAGGLDTEIIGKDVHFYPLAGSTNNIAYKLAKEGAPEGTVVMADGQTNGRGRLNRRWESPPGVNIYTSIILRPSIPPMDAPKLTMLSSVAVLEVLRTFLPNSLFLKWPNDVLVGHKKISGILAEMDAEADRVRFVILGIGINVNIEKEAFPSELRPLATSLIEETGCRASRATLLKDLYFSLERWYKLFLESGFEPVRERWERYGLLDGKEVAVRQFGTTIEGIAVGIDSDGALFVRRSTGEVTRIVAGDVVADLG